MFKKVLRYSSPVLAFIFLFVAFVSCEKKSSEKAREENKKDQVLHVYLQAEPLSLDPRCGGNLTSQMVLRHLFEGLMRVEKDGKVYPAVAKTVDISSDGLVYTFHLKKNFWSNGEKVTAHDFEYAWKSIFNPDFPSGFTYALACIKGAREAKAGKISLSEVGVNALNDKTLRVELNHPTPYFLELVAVPICYPVCRKVAEQDPKWFANAGALYVSNGPFTLDTWKHHETLILKKNPQYRQAWKVQVEEIDIAIVEDPQTALQMFERGELDWVGDPFGSLSLEVIPFFKKENKLQVQPTGGVYWFRLNVSNPLLSSKKVRQALGMAINRKEITEYLLQGSEQPAFTLLPPMLTCMKNQPFVDGDIQKAQKLFKEGLSELNLTEESAPLLILSHPQEPREKAVALAVQKQWQQALGLKVQLLSTDFNTHLKKIFSGDFDIAGSLWMPWYRDPMYNMEFIKYKDGGINGTHWQNPKYIRLLDLSDEELDPRKRTIYLKQAEELITNEMPLIPLYVNTFKYVKSPRVSGEYFSPLGQLDLKEVHMMKVGIQNQDKVSKPLS